MSTLHLVLTGYWFDMIRYGGKREEYRKNTDYWKKRLSTDKHYDYVTFHRGYTNTCATFRITGISLGIGKSCWGAPPEECFIISLGKFIY